MIVKDENLTADIIQPQVRQTWNNATGDRQLPNEL